MAEAAALVLLRLEGEAVDLAALAVRDHLRHHGGAGHRRRAEGRAVIRRQHQHFLEAHLGADAGIQLLNAQHLVFRDPILLAT